MNEQELREAFERDKNVDYFVMHKSYSLHEKSYIAGYNARQPEIDQRDKRIAELEAATKKQVVHFIGVPDSNSNHPDVKDAQIDLLKRKVAKLEQALAKSQELKGGA